MVKKNKGEKSIIITPYEDIFQILDQIHISTGHGCRDKMIRTLKPNYTIPRPAIETYLKTCATCREKKAKIQPINLNESLDTGLGHHVYGSGTQNNIEPWLEYTSGRLDLINMETVPDGPYKFLLKYRDCITGYVCLRPLKSKEETSEELLKIFLQFGAPAILQSPEENLKEIVGKIEELWPDVRILYGKAEDEEDETKRSLLKWMEENKTTNWSFGCHFVQFRINSTLQDTLKGVDKVKFRFEPKFGLRSYNLPEDVLNELRTEEDLYRYLENVKDDDTVVRKEISIIVD